MTRAYTARTTGRSREANAAAVYLRIEVNINEVIKNKKLNDNSAQISEPRK